MCVRRTVLVLILPKGEQHRAVAHTRYTQRNTAMNYVSGNDLVQLAQTGRHLNCNAGTPTAKNLQCVREHRLTHSSGANRDEHHTTIGSRTGGSEPCPVCQHLNLGRSHRPDHTTSDRCPSSLKPLHLPHLSRSHRSHPSHPKHRQPRLASHLRWVKVRHLRRV